MINTDATFICYSLFEMIFNYKFKICFQTPVWLKLLLYNRSQIGMLILRKTVEIRKGELLLYPSCI